MRHGACSRRPRIGRTSTPPRPASPASGSRTAITRSSMSGQPPAWTFPRGEQAAGDARSAVARLTGADARDIALIPSVSSAAGLVAAQFGPAGPGESIVIGRAGVQLEPLPLAAAGRQGLRRPSGPLPQRRTRARGRRESESTRAPRVVAFSGVQSATGHRSDIAAISGLARDGRRDRVRRRLATGRGAPGCRRPPARRRPGGTGPQVPAQRGPGHGLLLPVTRRAGALHAGQRGLEGGQVPLDSFFGPEMNLSATASRFDNSISWLAAIGNAGRAHRLRRIRARHHLRPQPGAHDQAQGRARPASDGTRLTCPNRTRARSSASRSATPSHRGFSAACPSRESSARRGMATCGSRFISTTMKTTSSAS